MEDTGPTGSRPASARPRTRSIGPSQEGLTGHVITARDGTASGSRWSDGSAAVEFVSCSYLGLETHPDLVAAATEAMRRFGLHFSTSRNRGRPPYLARAGGPPLRDVRRRAGGRLHLGQQRPSGLAAAARRRRPAQLSRGRRRRRVPRREDGARLHPGDPRRARADRADAALRHDRSRSAARGGPRGRGHRTDADRARRRRRLDGRPDRRGFDAGHHRAVRWPSVRGRRPRGLDRGHRSAPGTRSKRSAARSLPNVVLAGSLSKAFGGAGGFAVVPSDDDMRVLRKFANPLVFGHSIMLPMLAANVAAARLHVDGQVAELQAQLWRNAAEFDRLTAGSLVNAGLRSPVRGALFDTEDEAFAAARRLKAGRCAGPARLLPHGRQGDRTDALRRVRPAPAARPRDGRPRARAHRLPTNHNPPNEHSPIKESEQ